MKNFTASISLTMITLMGSILSPQVMAESKTLPGSTCEAYFGSQKGSISTNGVTSARNTSAGAVYVSCPMLRDRTRNKNGFRGAYVYATPGTRCTIQSRSARGAFADSQSLNFTGTARYFKNINKSSVRGPYAMYCLLQPNGQINSYTVNEYSPT